MLKDLNHGRYWSQNCRPIYSGDRSCGRTLGNQCLPSIIQGTVTAQFMSSSDLIIQEFTQELNFKRNTFTQPVLQSTTWSKHGSGNSLHSIKFSHPSPYLKKHLSKPKGLLNRINLLGSPSQEERQKTIKILKS